MYGTALSLHLCVHCLFFYFYLIYKCDLSLYVSIFSLSSALATAAAAATTTTTTAVAYSFKDKRRLVRLKEQCVVGVGVNPFRCYCCPVQIALPLSLSSLSPSLFCVIYMDQKAAGAAPEREP